MQERRAGSLPALRRPWPLALCQLVKSSLAGSPSHPRSLWGHSQVGGVSVSPPSRSQGSLPCALQGGGWTVSLGSLGDRTVFLPPRSAHTERFPFPRRFLAPAAKPRKYHRLQGFLWVLAVSHLSGQEEKRGEVIHPTPEKRAKAHQGASESNLPVLQPRVTAVTPQPLGSDPRGLVPIHRGPSLLSVY